MVEMFWNCYVEGSNGGRHYKHSSLKVAQCEAERLARLSENIGRRVHVLSSVAYCEVPEKPVEWHLF